MPQKYKNPGKAFNQFPYIPILFLTLVPITAHLLFSSLGFNPTDDGFTLAYSRRILEGQIPHLDFIIIRPFLSPLLHVPVVLWGGSHTYLLSRFLVWFQFACMSWAGVIIIEKRLKINLGKLEKICIALISFAVSAHTFRTMAWHTIDGLFLTSIGLVLCMSEKRPGKLTGYFMIGLAYLCKQNFVFLAPISIFLLGDWRKIRYWVAILLPGILYVIFLWLAGAMPDAALQLTSQNNFFYYGFLGYINPQLFLFLLIGYFSTRLIVGSAQINVPLSNAIKEWCGLLILSGSVLTAISLAFITGEYILVSTYWLFSLLVGVVGCLLLEKVEKPDGLVKTALIFLAMAWSASISIGWPYPDLASGLILALLLAFALPRVHTKLDHLKRGYLYPMALVFFSSLLLISFGVARMKYITRDLAATELTYQLDGVLPGGEGIRTNKNTHDFLADLQEAIELSKNYGSTYAIIPDCPGWWAKSPQANPLPIDWVQNIELNKPVLISRVLQDLEAARSSNIVIVQKVEAKKLRDGFIPFGNDFEVVEYVRAHFTKVNETSLFDLYK
jgi:hypothetical protein